MSREILNDLIKMKFRKQEFAQRFGVPQSASQRAMDDIIEYSATNNGIINTQDIVDSAQDVNALLHDLFNWEESNEYRLTQAELYLLYFGCLMSSTGDIYDIVLQEE